MRFPEIREFASSYRAIPDKADWAWSWHKAALLIRNQNKMRVGMIALLSIALIVSGILFAKRGFETYPVILFLSACVATTVLGYRHFSEIDDEVLRERKEAQHASPAGDRG